MHPDTADRTALTRAVCTGPWGLGAAQARLCLLRCGVTQPLRLLLVALGVLSPRKPHPRDLQTSGLNVTPGEGTVPQSSLVPPPPVPQTRVVGDRRAQILVLSLQESVCRSAGQRQP